VGHFRCEVVVFEIDEVRVDQSVADNSVFQKTAWCEVDNDIIGETFCREHQFHGLCCLAQEQAPTLERVANRKTKKQENQPTCAERNI
jgi:hypothetical protein